VRDVIEEEEFWLLRRQYLYLCTTKASKLSSKLSTWLRILLAHAQKLAETRIAFFFFPTYYIYEGQEGRMEEGGREGGREGG
jgi:hypothetical protein